MASLSYGASLSSDAAYFSSRVWYLLRQVHRSARFEDQHAQGFCSRLQTYCSTDALADRG